jgi:hypothetical protein
MGLLKNRHADLETRPPVALEATQVAGTVSGPVPQILLSQCPGNREQGVLVTVLRITLEKGPAS